MSVLNEINLSEVKDKLYEKLKPSGWGDKLKTFIVSDDFDKILKFLLAEAQAGKRFTPVLKQVFRAFEQCQFKDLKVVMVGQDPYPHIGVADGIAFSCSNLGVVQPSLKFMFKEIENTVYPDGYRWDPDLTRWSNQGVLLLNSSLTTTIGKVGQHYVIWQPFIAFLFDLLSHHYPNLVYVFMGKKAQEYMDYVTDTSVKIITSHPASAAHQQSERWESNDMFNKVNQKLKDQNLKTIVW